MLTATGTRILLHVGRAANPNHVWRGSVGAQRPQAFGQGSLRFGCRRHLEWRRMEQRRHNSKLWRVEQWRMGRHLRNLEW